MDKLIRCDVIVDQISSIRIKHTTTHLYLEDSPECFTTEAFDDEGNTFSSLEGLPFEWIIVNDISSSKEAADGSVDARNILRPIKFADSEYEVSKSIRQLESIGLSGHKMLIEGVKTGTAYVQSKLLDSFYKETTTQLTPLVRLLVVANILLEPSQTVYILIGGHVKYNVNLIKQTSIGKS
jgi:nuclear pore complex protein Nup210